MITFERVTKRYPDGTVAVDALDLEIPTGQTTILVGPSGCGKTTSLRMINRLIEPTSGKILIDGRDVMQANPSQLRRGIGYVIQQTGLFPHRTIEDNIATVPVLSGWGRAKARARARELMDLVGLDQAMARRYPHQLSGGQQQRVGVARALAADPPVLLMDEPFSAVDPIVRAALQDELLRLQGELHKTIVMVTHDVEEAIKVGDTVAVFRPGGHLAQVDAPERLLGAPADDYVEDFIGFDRGIRRLSFFSASGLDLKFDAMLAEDATVDEARRVTERGGSPWALVLDAERRPRGWIAAADLGARAGDSRLSGVPVAAIGHTFRPDVDSLRVALDATVLSRTERAVAVDDAGRVVGVTSYERLRDAIRAAEVAADTEDADRGAGGGPSDERDREVAGGITT
ncbi:MAG TPA: ATP-binding cassette domain-containing protein [Streptosporangiaceae bacterium]|nr:ATP-binding cassette domain-containing protein [Streptosporangiaceae bacterium]